MKPRLIPPSYFASDTAPWSDAVTKSVQPFWKRSTAAMAQVLAWIVEVNPELAVTSL